MTGTHHLNGQPTSMFGQVGRWLTLGAMSVAAAFMLFFSAAFALFLVGTIAVIAFISVAIFWVRAKLTGRPFGPRAQMEAQMEEIRRQMGAASQAKSGETSQGPIIDAHQTPEGWTVER
ncbi:MAG: hypothetical protein AAFP97_04395 [Pseudomonadota bacterium]